jgi:hypothetical protein
VSTRKVGEALLPILGRPIRPATVSQVAKQLDPQRPHQGAGRRPAGKADLHAVMNAKTQPQARSAARRSPTVGSTTIPRPSPACATISTS